MANNRLFIYDPDTNSAVMIAKHYCAGWFVPNILSDNNNLADILDRYFDQLEKNKGYADYEGTELQLLVEYQLPKNVKIIKSVNKNDL